MDQPLLFSLLFALAGYLLGSLPTALVISTFQGLHDPRQAGSGNAGATNMMRLYGKGLALLTLLGDVFKGFLIVWCYQLWLADGTSSLNDPVLNEHSIYWVTLIGMAVIVGHIYPVFFQFKGGKGVATILGVMLGTSLGLALFTLFCWLTALFITRVSAHAALISAVISPTVAFIISDEYTLLWLACSAVLVFSHRQNIKQLLASRKGFVE
jgi:glycerol-3-phosphate acyltransferase PlsY